MESLKKLASKKLKELRQTRVDELKARGDPSWHEWTLKSVAERLKVEWHTYQNWEDGRAWPNDLEKIKRLADFYEVPVGYFSGEDPKEETRWETLSQKQMAQILVSQAEEIDQLTKELAEARSQPGQLKAVASPVAPYDQGGITDDEREILEAFRKCDSRLVRIMALFLLLPDPSLIQRAKQLNRGDMKTAYTTLDNLKKVFPLRPSRP